MKPSLTQKFAALLALFVGIIITVLSLLVTAKNEPINFGMQEMVGNVYQRPVERTMRGVMKHRMVAQRALYGEKASQAQLADIQKEIDGAFAELRKADEEVGEALQFTEKGLRARKRERFQFSAVEKEWQELKGKVDKLKPAESNDLHATLIADLRGMVAHLGDTSNLILDPDLDSYYLMDVTLLALPQAQDRIQNVVVELEPIIRRKTVTTEERVKASVFASMMSESDSERIKGDFQTVLNEDPNFYGKSETLDSKLSPQTQKFLAAYKELIEVANSLGAGTPVPLDKFLDISDRAFNESFSYWEAAAIELDKLLSTRVETIRKAKIQAATMSIILCLLALMVAYFFMRALVRNMNSILQILRHSSNHVSSASGQSASSATILSESATEQAASLQETMASVEEISAMVSQNADSAGKTRDAVDANQKVTDAGSSSVDEMLVSIDEIKLTNDEILSQMEASNKEFGEIVKIISEIGEKTNVINEIVFQTKLLSFNASVEAARAGEHGKGFAVVAEEVGNLAQMSGNAAKEITDMLSDSIKKVNQIVEETKRRVDHLVEVGKDKIATGQSTAQRCRQSLGQITENARTIASMIAEISNASREQAQGVQEINKAISQLDRVTQQNSSVAQQSSSQAEQLKTEASNLSDAVQKLVVFVEGGKGAAQDHDHHTHLPSAHSANKVVKMPAARANKTAKAAASTANGTHSKKAAGDDVPASDNPHFEEF